MQRVDLLLNSMPHNATSTLSSNQEHLVIGDLHGCIDELKQLLVQNGFIIDAEGLIQTTTESENRTIILLGDFIDKGSHEKLAETIEFLYHNYHYMNRSQKRLYLVLGNHEKMIYRYVTNDPRLEITPEKLEEKRKYYNTATLLESDSDLRAKFLELYDQTYIWLHYRHSDQFSVMLTHAPCPVKHLGESDEDSIKKMVKCASRSKNRGLKLDDLLSYIHQEAEDTQHYHIFGHLSQPNIRQYKNKICIDTSAIYGDDLSAVLIKGNTLSFHSTPFQHKQPAATQEYNVLFDF